MSPSCTSRTGSRSCRAFPIAVTVIRDGQARSKRAPTGELLARRAGRIDGRDVPARSALPGAAARSRRTRPSSCGCADLASSGERARSRRSSFDVRAGEVVGLAGLVGAGRTEIVRAIANADVCVSSGEDRGRRANRSAVRTARTPRSRPASALITEDRKAQGLVLGMNVRQNTTLAHLDAYARGPFIDRSPPKRQDRPRARSPSCAFERPAPSNSCAIFRGGTSRRSCSRSG